MRLAGFYVCAAAVTVLPILFPNNYFVTVVGISAGIPLRGGVLGFDFFPTNILTEATLRHLAATVTHAPRAREHDEGDRRDEQTSPTEEHRQEDGVARAVPSISKLLPPAGVETAADAIELDALSESLDAAMAEKLGPRVFSLDSTAYAEAYRAVGRSDDRARQIALMEHLGQSLDTLPWMPVGLTYAALPLGSFITALFVLERMLRGSQAHRPIVAFGEPGADFETEKA